MSDPSTAQRRAQEQARAVLDALNALRGQRQIPKRALDTLLGRGPGYHAHLFQGRITFQVEHLYSILAVLGVEPMDFFARLYGQEAEWKQAEGEYTQHLEELVERVVERKLRAKARGSA